jgi:8-oxo-dGTP pyrophosphatase MutT (NUDIX family)
MHWHALAAATKAENPRRPFRIGGRPVGSVAAAHLAPLSRLRAFADVLTVSDEAVDLDIAAAERDAVFAEINAALREQGRVRAWRDEIFPVVDPETLEPLARFERAAARFWGTLTFGAHATGYVAGNDGRPERLWIARRSPTKATDPGLYDNLIGGGVPAGQTPAEALLREAFEEAGLTPALMQGTRTGSVLRLQRDIAEGFQHEWVYAHDIELPADVQPQNQDGEVAGFTLMPVQDALALAAGTAMTVDAALVTIDFALRHGLLDDDEAARRLQALRVARYA